MVNIGWLLLAIPVAFLLGLFIGENWTKWDRASRQWYQDEHADWWDKDPVVKPDWFRREAD